MIGYNAGNTEQNRDRVTKERRFFLSGVKLKTFQFKVKSRKDNFLSGFKLGTFIKIQERIVCEISQRNCRESCPGFDLATFWFKAGRKGREGCASNAHVTPPDW